MISVVIPVHNRAAIVGETLQSIAAQSVAPTAVILVDNNSTDGSMEVLRAFAAGRPGWKVVSEPRPGAAEARNRGLAEVNTPYVLFFDSDDLMPASHIERISAAIGQNPDADILYWGRLIIGLNGKHIHKRVPTSTDLMRPHIFHSTLSTEGYAVRTSFIRALGGWEELLPTWDDYVLGIKLLCANPRVARVADTKVIVRAQVESITGTSFLRKKGTWEAALDRAEALLARHAPQYIRLIAVRRAILAGEYLREGDSTALQGLTLRQRLIARYVSLGGRGVALLP